MPLEGIGKQVDITPLLGTWVNTNTKTEWIRKFVLARKGGFFTLHAYAAAPPLDWGEVQLSTYTDNIGERAFHAVYDFGSMEAVLAANTNKGLIIIAAFLRFKGEGAPPNFLCREFYYRIAPDQAEAP